MNIKLEWIAPLRAGMSEAQNVLMTIDTDAKTFEYTITPAVGSFEYIEVKRKSDLEELRVQLIKNGYSEV
jgi:hypothetical protein